MAGVSTSTRAVPLPPEERRAALVAAALPLVREHGLAVSTRQLAGACGVAEGTIFRVFPDKDALIRAVVSAATDPEPILAELARIDLSLPLRERMLALTTILTGWLRDIITLMMSIRPPQPGSSLDKQGREEDNDRISLAVTRLLEPDRAEFRMPLGDVVRILRALVFAGSHPVLAQSGGLTVEEMVDVLLDGTRRRSSSC